MLKIQDKDGKTIGILNDEDSEPTFTETVKTEKIEVKVEDKKKSKKRKNWSY